MKTESDKERRRNKHRNERRVMFATLSLDPKAMVKMPCLKCHVDEMKGKK